MSPSDIGGPSPKKFWTKNVVFNHAILRLNREYLRTGTSYHRPENSVATAITSVHAYQIW